MAVGRRRGRRNQGRGSVGLGLPGPGVGGDGEGGRGAGAGGALGAPQCSAPHAESEVIIELATANGTCGSRVSGGVATSVSSGATGAGGWSKKGRSLGACAAIWITGGAIGSGAAPASAKSVGRAIGAYSGPSSQVAMQSS